MDKEIQSIAISNGDANDPKEVTVVQSLDDPYINGIVALNPDGTLI